MRLIGTVIAASMVLGCHAVSEEEALVPRTQEEASPTDFSVIDSLYLSGDFDQVLDSLLLVIQEDSTCRDEAFFRMLGLHHGRAMEDEFIMLLDSLETAGYPQLWGWKVSALSLARRPEIALQFVPSHLYLLQAWLRREMDSLAAVSYLPRPVSLGEKYVFAVLSDSGSITPSMLEQLAEECPLFPSIRQAVLRELSLSVDTAGIWWDSLLVLTGSGPDTDILRLCRDRAASPHPCEYYLELQQVPGPLCTLSAREMIGFYPFSYSPSWDVADRLVETGACELAEEYSTAGDYWHRLGTTMMILLHKEKHNDLLALCSSIDSGAPDSILARSALFRAHALRGAGRGGSTCFSEYVLFSSTFPWHQDSREAAYNAGKYYDCEQEWEAAAGAYLTSLHSTGSWAGDERAHWRGGFSLYMSGRYSEADSLWEAGCIKWPLGYWRDEMLFWRARLAEESGHFQLRDSLLSVASVEHPWEFYGMLAADRMGLSGVVSFTVPSVRLCDDPVCSLAVELTADGYGVAALEMLSGSSEGSPLCKAIALSLLGRHGNALNALRMIDVSLRDSMISILPDTLLRFYFPAPYIDLAVNATDTLGLDANLLQGIMREESYFDRWIVSRAGARGVIQLMPGTAADVARWYGLPYLEEREFFDPFKSVPYGAIYIDRQRSSFNGETPVFLAAYNAGPGNASRWVDMHGWNPLDPEAYIEQITYRETRMYVKKVLRSSWFYERLES